MSVSLRAPSLRERLFVEELQQTAEVSLELVNMKEVFTPTTSRTKRLIIYELHQTVELSLESVNMKEVFTLTTSRIKHLIV